MAKFTAQISRIMGLKIDYQRERNTADLKIYSQLVFRKKHGIERYFFKIYKTKVLSIVLT